MIYSYLRNQNVAIKLRQNESFQPEIDIVGRLFHKENTTNGRVKNRTYLSVLNEESSRAMTKKSGRYALDSKKFVFLHYRKK